MKLGLSAIIASLSIAISSLVSATPNSKIDISCGSFYLCLSDEDIKSFVGKTLKYHHPGGTDFGDVVIQLKANGTAHGVNRKGVAGDGPWETTDGVVTIKFTRWGDSKLRFIRIGPDQLFLHVNDRDRMFLVPMEIGD